MSKFLIAFALFALVSVTLANVSVSQCSDYEYFDAEGKMGSCLEMCSDKHIENCELANNKPSCRCIAGYMRDDNTNVCVPWHQCME
ncbi:hypothetical protein BLOT_009369 [Blomia tropicalis]|nr:hypothetical protein BLOT_009369 [Blomia tropicalis]